jgi:hypothetical protein
LGPLAGDTKDRFEPFDVAAAAELIAYAGEAGRENLREDGDAAECFARGAAIVDGHAEMHDEDFGDSGRLTERGSKPFAAGLRCFLVEHAAKQVEP